MYNSTKLLSSLAKNNVLSLSDLRERNYPLFKYFINNYRELKETLESYGVEVLNDIYTLNSLNHIRLYLKFKFGELVNLSVLREKHRTVYNYLSKYGNPSKIVLSYGFNIEYSRKTSDNFILRELETLADANNQILSIPDPELYSKVYYRSRKFGYKNIKEYLKHLGFTYKEIDIQKIITLRESGLSFAKISKAVDVPASTVNRLYNKEVNKSKETR